MDMIIISEELGLFVVELGFGVVYWSVVGIFWGE